MVLNKVVVKAPMSTGLLTFSFLFIVKLLRLLLLLLLLSLNPVQEKQAVRHAPTPHQPISVVTM
jgi:hypothetical protein